MSSETLDFPTAQPPKNSSTRPRISSSSSTSTSTTPTSAREWRVREPRWPLPKGLTGVNLGGWLCLEDWFFSGEDGRYVDSDWLTGQGSCLAPEKKRLGFKWKSEGGLTKRLGKEARKAIGAHRRAFVTEADFAQAAKLGIKTVRIPITWAAFADALAEYSPKLYGGHDPDSEEVSVPDPFYHEELELLTIPRDFLGDIMDWAVAHELKVVWDIHAYIGGSANGTFNGIWPRVPAFWTQYLKVGNKSVTLAEAGLRIAHALIRWTEGLSEKRLSAVAGLTLMNEPGHLSWGKAWSSSDAVLDWLEQAADLFRKSSLPRRGVRLYVNLVETAFGGSWGSDFGRLVPDWWRAKFSADERREWAVLDRHKYYSWDTSCAGCDGGPCAWQCGTSNHAARRVLRGCIHRWQREFDEMLGEGNLRALSEFSAGTYRDAATACKDIDLARGLLEDQVAAFSGSGVEGFFWSWRIPYGPAFESGWSLKYLAGVEDEGLSRECA